MKGTETESKSSNWMYDLTNLMKFEIIYSCLHTGEIKLKKVMDNRPSVIVKVRCPIHTGGKHGLQIYDDSDEESTVPLESISGEEIPGKVGNCLKEKGFC